MTLIETNARLYLPGLIDIEPGNAQARIVVLAGADSLESPDHTALKGDPKRVLLAEVDNTKLTADSFIRIVEMLDIALKIKLLGLDDFDGIGFKVRS